MKPNVYIIVGPNGAGKTTFARRFLPQYAECRNFINADLIAEGLAPFVPEAAAFKAGKLVLEEISRYMGNRDDFAFETTLAGRSYLRLMRRLRDAGYNIHIFFLWLPTPEVALSRIRESRRAGMTCLRKMFSVAMTDRLRTSSAITAILPTLGCSLTANILPRSWSR